ncbi:FKBP12-interacting protein of 37 kDa-like [Silene latifolia]|uniref:FKBP12-interacting protein of 37 kDa-like n=1 Tax=Silene latifolia TaxID=37657 RepID=UPI003D77CE1D
MANHSNLDDDDDFGADFVENNSNRRSGSKRSFGELDDDEDDIFGSKKAKSELEEMAPGVATGMILSLRESLEKSKDDLEKCKMELETAKSEIQKWHSSFQNESFIPAGTSPEPKMVVNYALNLRSSEKSLKEQLEKAKKKEAAFIVTFAKREQEVAELKAAIRELRAQLKPISMQTRRFLLDPAIHEEFTRLKNLVEEKEKKVKELQDNINAVNFQPTSKMGKQLIARCKTLQIENEEIGNQASEGKVLELSMKLGLQKSQNAELRNQFEGLLKNVDVLTSDADRSNEMIAILQEKLEERDAEINRLKHELQLRNEVDQVMTDPAPIINDEPVSAEATQAQQA